ncbi:MAG: FixH family protein [Burkholderiaceae bacterium]|nr:FixH family protein [Burkholderiaceae bacterium]
MQRTLAMKKAAAPASRTVRPWYRHAAPWLLAIAPAAALLGGLVTLWLAVTTSDSLVVDDYYREGRAINQQLARDRLAVALGLRAELRFEPAAPAGGEPAVTLQLAADRGSGWPPELGLRIVHATKAALDREYRLEQVAGGRYRAAGSPPREAGHWLVQLEDAGRTWRLVAPSVTGFDAPLTLQAGAQ